MLDQDLYRDIVRSGLQNTNNLLFLQSYVYRLFISFTIVQSHRISRTCPDTLARDTRVIQEDEFSLFSFLRQISNREFLSLEAGDWDNFGSDRLSIPQTWEKPNNRRENVETFAFYIFSMKLSISISGWGKGVFFVSSWRDVQ